MTSARMRIIRQKLGLDIQCFYCFEYFPKEQAIKTEAWKNGVVCPNCVAECDYCNKPKAPDDIIMCDGSAGGFICWNCGVSCNVCGHVFHEDELVTDVDGEFLCDYCGTYCDGCAEYFPYDRLTDINYKKDGSGFLCNKCLKTEGEQ